VHNILLMVQLHYVKMIVFSLFPIKSYWAQRGEHLVNTCVDLVVKYCTSLNCICLSFDNVYSYGLILVIWRNMLPLCSVIVIALYWWVPGRVSSQQHVILKRLGPMHDYMMSHRRKPKTEHGD
jgi:hypothetical protein